MAIECLVLGAGQDVGKSCVIVKINGKSIMFDCGIHTSYQDHRRYPDFSLISKNSDDFTDSLSCIIITHFHLDHIGALPYFTQVCGYNGPIYMTYPTKALAPIMLEDFRKLIVEGMGEKEQFSSEDIADCMKKVTAVDLKQTIQVDKDLQIRAYYAGHVLGAAMFYAKVGDAAMLYTGDYNMTPDRHLGAAQIDRLQLDLVITESTYATSYRDSKYVREREFLKVVHKCVDGGGKVLIPAFALGRAQELCMILDDYWEKVNLKVPIYFSSGLTMQANKYYKILINWASQKVKNIYATRNPFDSKNVRSFDRSLINAPGPCVLFATPAMISGFSLEVFKQWAPDERNLVTLPGYCTAGSIGRKLMGAKPPTQITIDNNVQLDVRCQIHQLSFSPHTDAKGIMDLLQFLSPKHVILVHGELPKMIKLKEKIESELAIQCYHPANTETVSIPLIDHMEVNASDEFLQSCLCPNFRFLKTDTNQDSKLDDDDPNNKRTMPFLQVCENRVAQGLLIEQKNQRRKAVTQNELMDSNNKRTMPQLQVCENRVAQGLLIEQKNQRRKVVTQNELMDTIGAEIHEEKFAYCCPIYFPDSEKRDLSLVQLIFEKLSREFPDLIIQDCQEVMRFQSFVVSFCSKEKCTHRTDVSFHSVLETVHFCCAWSLGDEELAWRVISTMKNLKLGDGLEA